jgi:CHAT domain-containing protein/Tfp pilus assembly protein PilF
MAELYRSGKYTEAASLAERYVEAMKSQHGTGSREYAAALSWLAALYQAQGRYGEAERLMKSALAIDEKALGPYDQDVGIDLGNLAKLYKAQGRYDEAERLYERALAIAEKAPGADRRDIGIARSNLAGLYLEQGRYAEAEPLMKSALAISEKAPGPDHGDISTYLNNLALLYEKQGRYAEAEPLYKRALTIAEKELGPDHPTVGIRLNNLAGLYVAQNRYAKAEPLLKRGLEIAEKALGPDNPVVGTHLSNLAAVYFEQGDWSRAVDYLRRSTSVIIRRAQRGTLVGEVLTGNNNSEVEQLSSHFWWLVKAVDRLVLQQRSATDLARETFQTAQWAQSSEAATSLAQMAARGATGETRLAALVRERQDLVAEWQSRDQARTAAVAQTPDKRNSDAETQNVSRLAAIDVRIAEIDKDLKATFPEYAALASPAPLSLEDVQEQLGADEALVLFLDTPEYKPTPEETFIWVVTKTDAWWARAELGTPTLTREVAALRCGLDYEGAWIGTRCNDLLNSNVSPGGETPLPFDLVRAYALYKALFGQIEDRIKGKQLLIVPSGPLTQLPFQVLVTTSPKAALPDTSAGYRDVAWLAREHAITVLPAVSSLKALRQYTKQSHANDPYIGFGDPLLDGDPAVDAEDAARAKRAREAQCKTTQTLRERVASLLRPRAIANTIARGTRGAIKVADIRRQVPLPETADELCDVAGDLRVDPTTHVYLGAKATETEIKRLSDDGDLAKHSIVQFATHGLVAGELSGASEPGLLLTPPDKATEVDDGYLSASEVATLKLDADWVILSACNTAAGDTKDADALSGLARAFFYAGARSLLVSHWSVNSAATVKLITKAVDELKSNPKIGRAEALRRSMLAMIDSGTTEDAHPAFWAPFALVGEGGPGR